MTAIVSLPDAESGNLDSISETVDSEQFLAAVDARLWMRVRVRGQGRLFFMPSRLNFMARVWLGRGIAYFGFVTLSLQISFRFWQPCKMVKDAKVEGREKD